MTSQSQLAQTLQARGRDAQHVFWGGTSLGVPSAVEHSGSPEYEPPADVAFARDRVVVVLEVPGTGPQSVRMHLDGEVLRVAGVREPCLDPRGWNVDRLESWFGPWRRDLDLRVPVTLEGAVTQYDNGLLRIELARTE